MKKIYLRMVGGLGNQLYQFSCAYYLYKKFGYDFIVIDDTEMSKYNEVWGNLLTVALSSESINSIVKYEKNILLTLRMPKVFKKFTRICSFIGLINDTNINYFCQLPHRQSNLYLDGYFESFLHRSEYRELLSSLLKQDLYLNIDDNVVIVNVRGGEFVRLGRSCMKDRLFYSEAIKEINRHLKNPRFHLVTDDIEYALSLLDGLCVLDKTHKPDPLENFRVIYSSKFKILSDSTFSKWAGFLSEPNSFVIYKSLF